jgi:hypothetical protein
LDGSGEADRSLVVFEGGAMVESMREGRRGSGQRDELSQKKTGILTGYLIDIRRSKAKRGVPVGTWGVHKVVLLIFFFFFFFFFLV